MGQVVMRGEAVDALSTEVLKARLEGALSSLIQWEVSLLMAAVGSR